ncbi:extracellular solute-binding protein [Bifidobacterium amazonense]|uniref:Extracellular solute-binding protein n=1 Tax=Bifidobacterium amazonense TaxID=2809027 RepID=A0ABS9VV48_9BIFI|nr:extracellular solute-binding protein [Bifidobacterium amazonense]MCH9275985.1 extracellular solute-binding protein [Bifidobacterium amazonense]
MNKKYIARMSAAAAAAAMVVPLAACGGGTAAGNSNEITIFTQGATYEGTLDGYVGKGIKDATGLTVKVTPSSVGGTDRFQTKLTTGNLGDLVLFGSRDALKQAIDAGQVLDLNTVKDKLPNVFRFKDAVNRMDKLDSGKVYAIPSGVAEKAELSKGDPVNVPSLRYDYYKELGSPDIKDYWSYKDVAEAMAKAHPKTEKGDNFYALSLFGGWDGTSAEQIRSIAYANGWTSNDGVNGYTFINMDPVNKKVQDLLEDDSLYLQGLKWANSIYQDGMLDPDSATQTWDDYLKKAEKGQSAMWIYGYMGNLNFNPVNKDLTAQKKGYERISNDSMNVVENVSTIGGTEGWFWGVAKNAKNQAGALKFLNYMYGDEGSFTFENGPEGVLWKMNADGKPELTDLGKGDWSANVPDSLGGGHVNETFKARVNGPTVSVNAVNPKYNSVSVYNQWDTYLTDNASELDKEWSADHDGALNMKAAMVKDKTVTAFPAKDVSQMEWSKEDQVVVSQVGDVIKQYSWKMIYAKDSAEFNSLEKEMVKKAKALGYDKLVKFETKFAQEYFDAE